MAAADFYLKLGDIQGESQAVGFENQMQIESWSMGATNSGSANLGTGLGSGKVSMQDFHFVIQNGKASAPLMLACCKGTHYDEAILTCRKTGGGGSPYTFYKYTFNDVVVSSFQSGASQTLPMEQCSFNYSKIKLEYFQQKNDGSVSLTNTIVYDTKKVEGSGA